MIVKGEASTCLPVWISIFLSASGVGSMTTNWKRQKKVMMMIPTQTRQQTDTTLMRQRESREETFRHNMILVTSASLRLPQERRKKNLKMLDGK
jgi:hypothetical protein